MTDFTADKEKFLDLSLGQLADMTGDDPRTWADWFDCKTSVSIAAIYKVAECLDIPVLAILEIFEEEQAKLRR